LSNAANPVVEKKLVGALLRDARETAGMTQQDIATAVKVSRERIGRFESGAATPSEDEARALLELYGVTNEADVQAILGRLESARRRGWTEYKDVFSARYITYLGFEEVASVMRQYHLALMPGLLQTPAYMSETFTKVAEVSSRTARRLRLAREERQRLLTAERRPEFHIIVDEAVLRRPAGDAKVMREQLEHLVQVSRTPGVTLMLLPFSAGLHPALTGAFNLLEFEDDVYDNLIYKETADQLDRDDAEAYQEHRLIFEDLSRMSLTGAAFEDHVNRLIHDYEDDDV
jgi:transcriptional regulator with XRE-family HTH domain